MKKAVSMFLCLLLFLSLLSACRPSSESATATDRDAENRGAQGASGEPVEIDFWYSLSGKNGEVIEKMVNRFNASQTEVKVKASYQGDYYENHAKVMAAIAAGNPPDVTMIEIASIPAFASSGALQDLTPYVRGENGVDLNDFIPGLLGNSYWQGKFYALPFNRSTPLLYLNRDMLRKAGLNPEGPKTWDELRQFAKKLTKKDGKEQIWGFETPIDIWFYEALVFQNGGEILSEDGKAVRFHTEEGIEPIRFWKAMIDEGIMKLPPGEKYNAWEVTETDFVNGKAAMIFASTAALGGLLEKAPFDVGTAFLPAKERYGVPTGGANLVMLAKSSEKEKEAAWKFMKWMTDTQQTIAWSKQTGYMPVRVSAVESEEMKRFYRERPQFKVAVDQLQHAKPRPMSPGYKELQEVIMAELQRAVVGQATAEEAVRAAAEKAEKLLK